MTFLDPSEQACHALAGTIRNRLWVDVQAIFLRARTGVIPVHENQLNEAAVQLQRAAGNMDDKTDREHRLRPVTVGGVAATGLSCDGEWCSAGFPACAPGGRAGRVLAASPPCLVYFTDTMGRTIVAAAVVGLFGLLGCSCFGEARTTRLSKPFYEAPCNV